MLYNFFPLTRASFAFLAVGGYSDLLFCISILHCFIHLFNSLQNIVGILHSKSSPKCFINSSAEVSRLKCSDKQTDGSRLKISVFFLSAILSSKAINKVVHYRNSNCSTVVTLTVSTRDVTSKTAPTLCGSRLSKVHTNRRSHASCKFEPSFEFVFNITLCIFQVTNNLVSQMVYMIYVLISLLKLYYEWF